MGNWRTISIALRADTGGFSGAVQQAARDVRSFGKAADDAAGPSRWDRMRDSGGRALRGVATAFTGAAVAAGVLTGSVIAGGIAYNQLEQSASAAFTTLLGSQAEATEFMSELRDFAQSSPFPRQAFIEGAQQLVAFGTEADKVTGILGAVQDAVAASGGDTQSLQEVIYVLAQIQGQGRITGQHLMQLGQRGIDAAGLIGESMGKTGEQIRADISKGAIDASQAIDILVAGMDANFGGAAENLKNTWVGAIDRVRGALRDIGSDLVEPFISKEGGGLALDWVNSLADGLRSLQAGILPDVVDRLAEAGDKVSDLVARVSAWFEALSSGDQTRVLDFFREFAPLLSASSGAMIALGSSTLSTLPIVGRLLPTFGPTGVLVSGLLALTMASPAARDALLDVAGAAAPMVVELGQELAPLLNDLASILADVLPVAIQLFGAALTGALTVITPLVSIVGAFTSVLADNEWAILAIVSALGALAAVTAGRAIASGLETIALQGMYLGDALGRIRADAAARGISTAAAGMDALRGSIVKTAAAIGPAGIAVAGFGAIVGYGLYSRAQRGRRALEAATKSVEELKDALDLDMTDLDDVVRGMEALRDRQAEVTAEAERLGSSIMGHQTQAYREAAAEAEVLGDEIDGMASKHFAATTRIQLNALSLADAHELPIERVKELADAWGVDLTQSGKEGEAAVEEFGRKAAELGVIADMTGVAIEDMVEMSLDQVAELERVAEAMEEIGEATRNAYDAFFDLTQLQASDDDPINRDRILAFYSEQIAAAEQFGADLQTALAAGYDPQLIARIMAEGPEAAGDLLATLAANTDAAFVDMVNNGEARMAEFSEFAVRQAQLTQQAISLNTRDAAEQLTTAIAIEMEWMKSGETMSASELANRLGMDVEDINAAIQTFNLDIEFTADVSEARREVNAFATEERIADIVAVAHMQAAEEGLSGFTARERVAEIVAEALMDDAQLAIDETVNAEYLAQIVALAITSNADGSLNTVAGRERIARIIAQAGGVQDFEAHMAALTRDRRIRVLLDPDTTFLDRTRALFGFADGGVTSYASGGIHKAVGPRGVLRFAEPETGGEAFVPRRGIEQRRARSILDIAAGWHGFTVVDKRVQNFATGGVAGYRPVPPRPVSPAGMAGARSTTITYSPTIDMRIDGAAAPQVTAEAVADAINSDYQRFARVVRDNERGLL